MTLEQFRLRFPVFAEVEDEYIEAHLEAAELRTPVDIWGAKQADGIGYLAAHLMALSPWGEAGKLTMVVNGTSTTSYGVHRKALEGEVRGGVLAI